MTEEEKKLGEKRSFVKKWLHLLMELREEKTNSLEEPVRLWK